MRNLLSRMSWNSGEARAAVVGLADVAEVVALEGVEGFGDVWFQLRPGPNEAGPGQLRDGGDGVQFGDDAERVPEPVPAFIRKVWVGRDGVGSDDREAGEFDLEFHEIYEDVLGVEFAVSTAAGHLCGRGGGVFGPDGVERLAAFLAGRHFLKTASVSSALRVPVVGRVVLKCLRNWAGFSPLRHQPTVVHDIEDGDHEACDCGLRFGERFGGGGIADAAFL